METVSFVTAASRPDGLRDIYASILQAVGRCGSRPTARWIVVFDEHQEPPGIQEKIPSVPGRLEVKILSYPGGRCIFGIAQKNMGLDSFEDGWFNCLDDDNIVHPDFFSGLERALSKHPKSSGFVFSQKRWDKIGDLRAVPTLMRHGALDNAMFVLHRDLIGPHRYNIALRGMEDWVFFEKIWKAHPRSISFIDEQLCYYNYLRAER